MLDAETFAWAVMGFLNAAVALLLLSVRPRRPAHVVAAVLVGANALFAVKMIARLLLGFAASGLLDHSLDLLLAPLPFVSFMVFPLLFPRRFLSLRGERVLLGAAVGLVLLNWAILAGGLLFTGRLVVLNNPADRVFGWTLMMPFLIGLAAGAVILAHVFTTSASRTLRDQARFILAAYVLKLGTYVAQLFGHWSDRTVDANYSAFLAASQGPLVAAALICVLYVLGASRVRGHARAWGEDLFVLVFVAVGLGITFRPGFAVQELEYMVIRPLLFAYPIVHFQLLDVDVRRHAGLIGAGLVAVILATFLGAVRALRTAGLDDISATGAAMAASLGLGAGLAWPILKGLTAPRAEVAGERNRAVYQAAVESALAGGRRSGDEELLRQMRFRLGISDREHARLEASARAAMGEPVGELAPGSTFLGRFEVERPLGAGGFGATFLARDTRIGRPVVIKQAALGGKDAARFLREARTIAKLRHPNIVTLYDVEEVAGSVYLVMEWVEGGSLAERATRTMPVAEAVRIFGDVLTALEAAHQQGIVHRDVKPANILLGADGRARLADFGIAHSGTETGTAAGLSFADANAGSIAYMAPEQVRGARPDARGDLYSWAASLYEVLAGRSYLGDALLSPYDLRVAIVERPPDLPIRKIPGELNAILAACLAKDPAGRPANVAEVARRLSAVTPGAGRRRSTAL